MDRDTYRLERDAIVAAYLKGPVASMSRPPLSKWWCDGKVAFESAVLATEVAGRSKGKGRRGIYRCESCGRFHVSNRGPHDDTRQREPKP
jgi:hypothetical protein